MMQLIAPTYVITLFFNIHVFVKRLNICVDSKIAGSADEKNIIQIADKSYCIRRRGCKPSRPQMV